MGKKILPSIGIFILILIGALFVIWIGYLVFMRIFHPAQGTALQKTYIQSFARCSSTMEMSDEAFSEEWKTLSTNYDFTAQDVDKEIRKCQKKMQENNGKILERYDEQWSPVYLDLETTEKVKAYQEKFLSREFPVFQ